MDVVGLDISSTSTGVCVFKPTRKKVYLFAVERLTKSIDKSKAFRTDIHPKEFTTQVIAILEKLKVKGEYGLCIEKYTPGKNKNSQWVPVWLQGYIAGVLEHLPGSCPKIDYVHQSIWKYTLIGHRTKGKEFVREKTFERVQALKYKLLLETSFESEDAYDAFGIAYWYWKTYC